MDMPVNKMVEFKYAKDIDIVTFWRRKSCISLILACADNGNKLPSVLMLKAKRGGILEKTLCSLSIDKRKKLFIFYQQKAGFNNDNFINWLKIFMSLKKL